VKRLAFALVVVLVLLVLAPPAHCNWFCGVMDPYPGYGHPSFYFPPAVAAFYAGYGYPSLIPGTHYYTPTAEADLHAISDHGYPHTPWPSYAPTPMYLTQP
jgi:hypothetical protein